jgi:hypothetical protein
MGFYTRFKDPEARKEIVRYYQFLAKYDDLYRGNTPCGEVLLLYPRKEVHAGKLEAVERFKKVGKSFLDDHTLFDVCPDDSATAAKRSAYKFVTDGKDGVLWVRPITFSGPSERVAHSTFTAPKAVRVSASKPAKGNEVTLHFVNYNRTEPKQPKSPGGGIKDEKPIAVEGVKADFVLPKGAKVKKVIVATPEEPEGVEVKFEAKAGRVKFEMPKFLVYAIARIVL